MIERVKTHLHLKVSLAITTGAIIAAVIASAIFYTFSYTDELKRHEQVTRQLVETVGNTAAIALYLGNNEMAGEVAHSLLQNDIISNIIIKDQKQVFFSSITGSRPSQHEEWIEYHIYSPFDPDATIGIISYQLNNVLIKGQAKQIALKNAITLACHSLLVAFLSMFLVYVFLTTKLRNIALRLHIIKPGETKDRLPIIKNHEHDELGVLVTDINNLLEATDKVIGEKENLISELEKTLEEIKTLRGIIPVCANCKDIRDDEGIWNQMEKYVSEHSEVQFSHSICPKCKKKAVPVVN